jgi:hypothetical protein
MNNRRIDIYMDKNENINGSSPGCMSEWVKFRMPNAKVESLYTGSVFLCPWMLQLWWKYHISQHAMGIVSFVPLQLNIPSSVLETWNVDLQLLSRPRTYWEYFSMHNNLLFGNINNLSLNIVFILYSSIQSI